MKIWVSLIVIFAIFLNGCGPMWHARKVRLAQSLFRYSPITGYFTTQDNVSIAYKVVYPKNFEKQKRYPLIVSVVCAIAYKNIYRYTCENLEKLSEMGFISATIEKRGISPSKGNWYDLDRKRVVQDNVDFIRFLKTLPEIDSSSIILMGHSGGADLALSIALEEKQGIRGIIYSGAAPNEYFFEMLAKFHAGRQKELKELEMLRRGTYPKKTWGLYPTNYWHSTLNHSSLDEFRRLDVPILIIIGKEDDIYPYCKKAYNLLVSKGETNFTYHELEGVGHDICPQKEKVFKIISEWIKKEFGLNSPNSG